MSTEPPVVEQKIQWIRQEDVERVWIHKGLEYSHRLVTNKRQGASLSFHITTYEPNFDTIVEGRGHDEVVLYCLEGDSRQIVEETGVETHFTPGMAVYSPRSIAIATSSDRKAWSSRSPAHRRGNSG
jgi:L-ectoine synthase